MLFFLHALGQIFQIFDKVRFLGAVGKDVRAQDFSAIKFMVVSLAQNIVIVLVLMDGHVLILREPLPLGILGQVLLVVNPKHFLEKSQLEGVIPLKAVLVFELHNFYRQKLAAGWHRAEDKLMFHNQLLG
jgi:hypothetical protein